MKLSEHKEIILRYIKGNMPYEERVEFEKKLDTNKGLADEMMSYVVNEYEDDRLRSEIKQTQTHFRFIHRKNLLKWAALILIFLSPAGYFLQQYLNQSSSLLTDYYSDYPAQSIMRGNLNAEAMTTRAFLFYAEQNYNDAAKLFREIIQSHSNETSAKLQLYAGISWLRTENPENYQIASQYFREVLVIKNEFNQAAEWFLAISLFESGDKAEARGLFEKIADSENHYNQQKAKEVLKEKY